MRTIPTDVYPSRYCTLSLNSRKLERWTLLLSAAGALFIAALGIGFFLLTHSEAIILDGLYSMVGFVMALTAIRVSKLVYEPSNIHFQFGYAGFGPLFNEVKGLVGNRSLPPMIWKSSLYSHSGQEEG